MNLNQLPVSLFVVIAVCLAFQGRQFAQTKRLDQARPTAPNSQPSLEPPQRQAKPHLKFRKYGGVVYKTGSAQGEDYELRLDVYVPEGKGKYPAILAVHGGSWTSGTKLHMIRHAWKMAARGYVVVAINYRHAPKYKHPAQIHDCKHAVRWIRHHAREYKIDPAHIGGFGYSAGGHLVSLLGTTDPDNGLEGEIETMFREYSTRLQAVAAGGAPCEFEWVGSNSLAYWIGATRNQKPELYRAASPTAYVDRDDPPFYLYHGENDMLVPLSSTLKMRDELRKCMIQCTHETVHNKGHLATFSDFDCLDRVLDFFDSTLK